ncbi:MAG TPA: D-arabinono-1,4-lactone oxidase [Solirubrobacteraceae bacterium]|nr:D-arabinono-1,4-lactone oxidase [Solirubrobacteraceae bacterium]
MTAGPLAAGDDGYHHPASEDELVALVRMAYREGRQLRVRGAAHSISHAIYTDPLDRLENRVLIQAPPPGDGINVMLDRYAGWRVVDEERRLVEADAGLHLGADPGDPLHGSPLEKSLLWNLHQRGWTLFDTGGVTHQTVSGFTATGSAGGSVQATANRNLHGFRVVDGRGDVHDVTRDGDADAFDAMCPNLGLLGVVSKITFECTDTFDVSGQEAATTIEGCAVDLFGAGGDGRPSLEEFLRGAQFSRLEWWPQRGAERVLVWQCQSLPPQPGFRRTPYRRFGDDDPERTQHFISVLFTILGNLDDLSRARQRLEDDFEALERALEMLAETEGLGHAGDVLAAFLSRAIALGVDAAITMLQPIAGLLKETIPQWYPKLIDAFVPLDEDRKGVGKGQPATFRDHAFLGLPMDNAADDTLLPTQFTEIWVPLGRTREVMGLLRDYFAAPEDDDEAYRRTGTYAWELYAAEPSPFWLNASYSAGDDEWKDGAFRVDPYVFAENAGDPRDTLFAPVWELLRERGVPFRLHWGKFHPAVARGDDRWVEFLRAQYPRWDDFLALRERRDPNNLFLTDYWRHRFGLWDAPRPTPQPGSSPNG